MKRLRTKRYGRKFLRNFCAEKSVANVVFVLQKLGALKKPVANDGFLCMTLVRFERATFSSGGRRSIQLSYSADTSSTCRLSEYTNKYRQNQ